MWIEGLFTMITRRNTRPDHQMRPRMRVALFVAGLFALLALAVTSFVHPPAARAFDSDYYEFCTQSLGQQQDVCCDNAGGELFNGGCFDPERLNPPVTAVPTVTQQILPPAVFVPAP